MKCHIFSHSTKMQNTAVLLNMKFTNYNILSAIYGQLLSQHITKTAYDFHFLFFIWSWNYSNTISQTWFQLQNMLHSHSIFLPQTPWSSVLPQLVRKTTCTRARLMQSTICHPTFLTYILILFFYLHLCLPSGLFSSGLPTKPLIHFSSLTCLQYPAHLNLVTSFPYKLYYPICFPLTNWSFHQVQLSTFLNIILHKHKVPSVG